MLHLARSFRSMTPPHQFPNQQSTAADLCSNGRRCLVTAAAAATSTTTSEGNAATSATAAAAAETNNNRTVTILQRGPNHIVALKPPAVVCHHSGWAGSRSNTKRGEEPEIPMLQRVRDAIHDIDTRDLPLPEEMEGSGSSSNNKPPMRKVNLVHRLDRGASGALLLTYAEDDDDTISSTGSFDSQASGRGNTAQLIEAMAHPDSIKTYIALVRGEGILHGEDLKQKGWFEISRPIKDEGGERKEASTLFNFVAGQPETGHDRPRISLVLARPKDGRWHQIRRHLNGLSHPILGDSTHGHSKTNGIWKRERNLPGERIALHLGRLELVPTENIPEGIDVSAPLLEDMLNMLRVYAPGVLERSLPVLEQEGILVEAKNDDDTYQVGKYTIPEAVLESQAMAKDDSGDVDILVQSDHYVVVRKPPVVVVHHSNWTGKRSDPKRRWKQIIPMLQRVRDKTGRRVNLVHRLDRGASGCLLLTFAETSNERSEDGEKKVPCKVTKTLIESMQSPDATKTYMALCDGDGTWNGVDYLDKGWFTFDKPVKDEWGKLIDDSRTDICFVASATLPPIDDTGNTAENTAAASSGNVDENNTNNNDDNSNNNNNMEGRKVSIVLARPHTGRWHQIRQHLASGTIGHAILGDSSHGRSRTNRLWKKKRHLMKERTCLHLARIQLPVSEYAPEGIDVACPLPPDLMKMLRYMPRGLVEEARPILSKEGISI